MNAIERELDTALGLASCQGDEDAIKQAHDEVAGLRMALAQAETIIERMQSQINRAVILLRDIAADPCSYDMEKQPAIYCANKFLAEFDGEEWPTLGTPNVK